MDAHTLEVLELPVVLERLAAETATPQGGALAAALTPSPEAGEVGRRQELTEQACLLLERGVRPGLGGVVDVREDAGHAARGSVLAPPALHRVARSVEVTLAARSELSAYRETAPALADLLDPVDPGLAGIATAVRRAITDEGDAVRDDASPHLASLRRELRSGRQRIADALHRIARAAGSDDALQEAFVTERAGRPVLAVKASSRSKVPGIVHDASGSGQTLFVEPFPVVELSNRLSEVAGAEREEVERILRELSGLVGEREPELGILVEATASLDLAVARGVLSRGWHGAAVTVGDDVRLLGARHPLLDPARAVPVDLDLGAARALVVSGPNTGGKTVALKTLGLAALLHQSGLRPPAARAELPVFDQVLADIGDEQSIEMSLSTFSGHLRNIVSILDAATRRTLVVLDELASGTDPVEGSALAQAVVERLARQARLTVVTTHYAELKEWASAAEVALNAGTALDPESGAPSYRLALGRPGTSQALRIAERLGLDPDVIEDARSRIAPDRLRIDELVAEAEAAERAAQVALDRASAERAAAAAATARAEAAEARLEQEIEAVQASAERERQLAVERAERDLAEARKELEALREEIRVARRREKERSRAVSAPPRAAAAERERDRRLGAASARSERAARAIRELEPPPVTAPLAAGDPVEAPEIGVWGTIAAIEGDQAEVLGRGGLRVRVPLQRLRPARVAVEKELPPSAVSIRAAARSDVPDELDVRGRTAQEAREAVRAFVDDASLAGRTEVRVIHGRGTGAVRKAVREELSSHPLVASHVSDSADGATVVRFGGAGPE